MVCTAQVGELGRERDWNTYMYMCTIYIFSHAHYMYTVHCTAQVRELGRERERERLEYIHVYVYNLHT